MTPKWEAGKKTGGGRVAGRGEAGAEKEPLGSRSETLRDQQMEARSPESETVLGGTAELGRLREITSKEKTPGDPIDFDWPKGHDTRSVVLLGGGGLDYFLKVLLYLRVGTKWLPTFLV